MTSLIYTCQTIKEYNVDLKKNIKTKNPPNKKSQLYRTLSTYTDITNNLNLFLELQNKLNSNTVKSKENSYCWINWKKITIPEKIKYSLENKVKIDDFYPNKLYVDLNSEKKSIQLTNIFNNKITQLLNIKPSNEIYLLLDELAYEIYSFTENNNTNQKTIEESINKKNLFHYIINSGDYFLLNSIDYKQYMFLSEMCTFIVGDQYILFIPHYPEKNVQINLDNVTNNYLLITDKQFYLKKNNLTINVKYTFDTSNLENIVYGYIKDKFKKELFNIRTNNKCDLKKNYRYTNNETKMAISSYTFYDYKKKIEYLKYNKNNCDFEEYYNHNNHFKHIISQCMVSDDSTGLRYRGKYTETSKDGKPIKKSIEFDDELKYLLEGDEVKVDMLENKPRKNNEGFVAYKIAKSENDDLRIVKLFVPPDAKVIRPIDEEYFISFGKERCDKAIVMDIQLPIKDNEISVVPDEMIAYSYIHKINGTNSFEYKVGQEVYPDGFDSDENTSCGKGLHFFQDRIKVFKAFVDNV